MQRPIFSSYKVIFMGLRVRTRCLGDFIFNHATDTNQVVISYFGFSSEELYANIYKLGNLLGRQGSHGSSLILKPQMSPDLLAKSVVMSTWWCREGLAGEACDLCSNPAPLATHKSLCNNLGILHSRASQEC